MAILELGPNAPLVPPAAAYPSEAFVRSAGHARRTLAPALHDALVDFADAPPPSGALLVRGLALGVIPPTPDSPTTPVPKDRVSEFTLLTVARCLGQPVGYLPELGGDLIQNLVPVAATAGAQVSTSSRVELLFHTEAAFHPHKPRYLLLLCLRGDPQAHTTLAAAHDALARLAPEVIAVLSTPRFRTAPDESYVGTRRTELLGDCVPVLWGDRTAPCITFDADLMVGTDPEATAALAALAEATAAARQAVTLTTGDLLVVDNTRAVHGRSPFTARFDGTDRWLQRSFVVADLVTSAAERRGRVICTSFA